MDSPDPRHTPAKPQHVGCDDLGAPVRGGSDSGYSGETATCRAGAGPPPSFAGTYALTPALARCLAVGSRRPFTRPRAAAGECEPRRLTERRKNAPSHPGGHRGRSPLYRKRVVGGFRKFSPSGETAVGLSATHHPMRGGTNAAGASPRPTVCKFAGRTGYRSHTPPGGHAGPSLRQIWKRPSKVSHALITTTARRLPVGGRWFFDCPRAAAGGREPRRLTERRVQMQTRNRF